MSTARSAKKPADDEPFDFNLDTVQYEGDLAPFRVQFGGRRWQFVHMQQLNCWDLIEAARGGDIEMVCASFKLALGDQYDAFRKIHLDQYKLMPLFRAWQQHCGVEDEPSPLSGAS
ncbi:hypothetical protein ADL21_11100 [Streptomyces albus subsp. albus]|nr:hypothetical protein ADL21_11100 [Streptomyces albus subsp. albus]